MSHCQACGQPTSDDVHARCADPTGLEPPRFCTRCGRRLDVQVFPTGIRATCRSCDGVHPARRPTTG